MAGTINLSLSQQLDSLGHPLAGGLLYFIQAGTTSTPQNAYQDSALTLALPNPLTLDSAGRIPQFFLADGSIKIRLTDRNGVNILSADGLLVIGASSGGGGGSTVDPTTILATGDLKARYGIGILTGFVRSNGRTIGSASSGATERANADTQSLFEYLWGADANLTVSTGRGASANADWVANKTLTLPDWRGRALAFLDDMGNSAAGRLSASYFGAAATVLGASGGAESKQLALADLPGGITASNPSQAIAVNSNVPVVTGASTSGRPSGSGPQGVVDSISAATTTSSANNSINVSVNNTGQAGTGAGAAAPIRTVQPTMLATIYMKL